MLRMVPGKVLFSILDLCFDVRPDLQMFSIVPDIVHYLEAASSIREVLGTLTSA